jgi:hypothetical protein
LLTKVRTLIHEETGLLTVLYFPFRVRTPSGTQQDGLLLGLDGLLLQQSGEEYNVVLDATVQSIYDASNT